MYEIDPDRIELAQEYRAKIFGRHSGELQRVLNRMRFGDAGGRYVVVAEKSIPGTPSSGWLLARMGAQRGDPLTPVPGFRFASLGEAEWAVFKLRWKDLTGRDLPLD